MTVNALAPTGLELEVVLAHKEEIADDVVRLTFRHPAGLPLPSWLPGAHLELVLGPGLLRQYSLCGDPGDRSTLEVAVLHVRDGRGGSRFVHERLRAGDRVLVRGPRNHFPLVGSQRYLFLAGGIGITPLVPMIAAADEAGADWELLYAGRTLSSMAFADELVQKYGDLVTLCPSDEGGLPRLDELFASLFEDTAVYCCGPESLLAEAEYHHRSRPDVSLFRERFSPKEVSGVREEFDVQLARSGVTLTVPADRSVLDVAEDAGVPVFSSCREGTCGTCETRVLDGTPDHRDSVLTDAEQAACASMMICVSRARGRLVLDL